MKPFYIVNSVCLFFLMSCANNASNKTYTPIKTDYSITIIQSDYSSGVNLKFILSNDSLTIIKHYLESTDEVFRSKTDSLFQSKLNQWLVAYKKLKLENEYINDDIKDGIQIYFEIKTDENFQRIKVSNYYLPTLGELTQLTNDFLTDRTKIRIYYENEIET